VQNPSLPAGVVGSLNERRQAQQPVQAMEESALIRAAQQGDQDAFESLVRQYDNAVLRLAWNMLRSEQDASEVFQETFLRVHRNLHNFRFDCNFQTWLLRIASNLCLDYLRRRKVRREEPAIVRVGEGEVLDRMDNVPEPRGGNDPERRFFSSELRTRIASVLEALTPRERVVFEMRHYQGLRLRAIGEAMGTSEEAARNCLFRATQKMRAALGDFV
jgi:RNA polymerase sigma-70 factor, ECF subfamily